MVRLIALLLLAVTLWLCWALLLPVTPPSPQILLFPTGSSSHTIAAELEQAGVVRSRWAFELLRLAQPRRSLKAGEYRFVHPANAVEVFRRIARGDVLLHPLVIPEGYNIFEIAGAVEAAGFGQKEDFLKVARDPALVRSADPVASSLEGYLFPDTYQFSRTAGAREIAVAMLRRFQHEAQRIGLEGGEMHRVVTLASIVEKETAQADERAQVASVYTNRLDKQMALAADPTVAYAAMLGGRWRGTIYQSDLAFDSPYNTYRHAGLPPGPIANPGAASLEAAMHPAATAYLFFVAVGDGSGRHHFTATYEQHERNVAAYRHAAHSR
jgi:UPF0755 protein